METAIWPTCAVCRRPVERMERYRDEANHQDVFVAYCHGASEVTAISDKLIAEARVIEVGEAFASTRASNVTGLSRSTGQRPQAAGLRQHERLAGDPLR